MRRMLSLMAAGAVLAVAACGGSVVVDLGAASGGLGGAGGVSTGSNAGGNTGNGPNGQGGASCFNPPNPSTLTFCTGTASSGGSTVTCENDFCDAHANTWAAVCTKTTCQCKFNAEVICTCALNGPGNFCLGTPSCCPLPMPGK